MKSHLPSVLLGLTFACTGGRDGDSIGSLRAALTSSWTSVGLPVSASAPAASATDHGTWIYNVENASLGGCTNGCLQWTQKYDGVGGSIGFGTTYGPIAGRPSVTRQMSSDDCEVVAWRDPATSTMKLAFEVFATSYSLCPPFPGNCCTLTGTSPTSVSGTIDNPPAIASYRLMTNCGKGCISYVTHIWAFTSRASDDRMLYNHYTCSGCITGGTWGGWTALTGGSDGTLKHGSSPAVMSQPGSDKIDIFVWDPNNKLAHRVLTPSTGSFGSWEDLGTPGSPVVLNSDPAVGGSGIGGPCRLCPRERRHCGGLLPFVCAR